MMHKGPARVVVNEFRNSGVDFDAFESKEAMLQHFIARHSFTGCWGDPEHLAALTRLQVLLASTIKQVSDGIEIERRHETDQQQGLD